MNKTTQHVCKMPTFILCEHRPNTEINVCSQSKQFGGVESERGRKRKFRGERHCYSRFTYKSIGGTRNLKTARLWLYTTVLNCSRLQYYIHYNCNCNCTESEDQLWYSMTTTFRHTYISAEVKQHAYTLTHSLTQWLTYTHTLPGILHPWTR